MTEKLEYPREKQFDYESGWEWMKEYCKKYPGYWLSTESICKAMMEAEMAKNLRDYEFEMPLKEVIELIGSLTLEDLAELDDYKTLGGLRGYINMFEEEEKDGFNYLSLRRNGLWCFKNANTGEYLLLSETKFYNILRKKYEEKHSAGAHCEKEVEDSNVKKFHLVGFKTLLERQSNPDLAYCAKCLGSLLERGYTSLIWEDGEWYVNGEGMPIEHLNRDSDCYPNTTLALDFIKDSHLMPYFWED